MPYDVDAFVAQLEQMIHGLPQNVTAEQIIAGVTTALEQSGAPVPVAIPTGEVPPTLVQAAIANPEDVLHRIESGETIYTIAHDAYGDSSPEAVAKITQDPRNDGVAIDWDATPTGARIWIPA